MKLLLEFIRVVFVILALATIFIGYKLYDSGWIINASGLQMVTALLLTILIWRYGLWPAYKNLVKLVKAEIK